MTSTTKEARRSGIPANAGNERKNIVSQKSDSVGILSAISASISIPKPISSGRAQALRCRYYSRVAIEELPQAL